jgi:hypothetical protein
MGAIRMIRNPYPGINAHLHSYWQNVAGWVGFHTAHMTLLMMALKRAVAPLGYTVQLEDSVQIRRLDEYWVDPAHGAEPDIAIYDVPSYRSTSEAGIGDTPVAWIELLSPSNKRRNEDGRSYLRKRRLLLEGGVVFVEIDYLHESAPTLPVIPAYIAENPETKPYRILVFDPRPTVEQGQVSINGFAVGDAIPEVRIPLREADSILFDFNEPYQRTLIDAMYGTDPYVDYGRLPVHFERYNVPDQTFIACRVLALH